MDQVAPRGFRTAVRFYPAGYGPLTTAADYRPFDVETDFLAVWRVVRGNTLVDRIRLHELWHLVAQAFKVPGDVLEVGSWRGGSAGVIARRALDFDATRVVFVADTFSGVVKAGDNDPYYRGGEHANTSVETVQQLFDRLEVNNTVILQGMFPEDTAARIADRRFALCHIDVDVYQSASDVFDWIWPRLSRGGVVVFDDYGFLGCEGVTRLVHELRQRPDLVALGNPNGHAVLVKT